MKQGQCICPLSWSVHCNFTGDGKCNKKGWACTPYPHQPRQILPSWLNVRQKADVTTLCTPLIYGVLCDAVHHIRTRFTNKPHPIWLDCVMHRHHHAQSTYIRRVQFCVWRLPKYWPSHPPLLLCECVLPPPGDKGDGGSIFWKTPAIGSASYNNLSMVPCMDHAVAYWVYPMHSLQNTIQNTNVIPLVN